MSWKKIPQESPEGFSTQLVLMTAPGEGFSTSKQMDVDKLLADKDFKKRDAEDPAFIFRIRSNWSHVEKVFETTGVFEGLYRTGIDRALAVNRTYEEERTKEVYRLYGYQDGRWREISRLEQDAIFVLGSDSPWLLAIGYSGSSDHPFSAFSPDGGHTWKSLPSLGIDFIRNRKLPLWLDSSGSLYHPFPAHLGRLRLEESSFVQNWERIEDFPPGFKPTLIAGTSGKAFVLGLIGPEAWSLWIWDGPGKVQLNPCRGLPKGFTPRQLVAGRAGLHLVGDIAQFNARGEMSGFKNQIYRSNSAGSTWVNMDLPITGSLEYFDFGDDGSIWAMAAGNRLQIYGP